MEAFWSIMLLHTYVRKKSNPSITLLFVFKTEQGKKISQCLSPLKMRQLDFLVGGRCFAVSAATGSSFTCLRFPDCKKLQFSSTGFEKKYVLSSNEGFW